MSTRNNGSTSTPAGRVLARVLLYYLAVAIIGGLVWRYLPRSRIIQASSLEALFGEATETVRGSGRNMVITSPDQGTLAITVAIAMFASGLLTLPVAWIYTLTRSK